MTLMHLAARVCDANVATTLRATGAAVDAVCAGGPTPLLLAAAGNLAAAATGLLEQGASVHAVVESTGASLLACFTGCDDLVSALLACDVVVDVAAPGGAGRNPLLTTTRKAGVLAGWALPASGAAVCQVQ